MKLLILAVAVSLVAGLGSTASAQTLQKINDSNQITVSYREASVPSAT